MSGANVAPITATDSLSQALKANIIPNQEYLLQVTFTASSYPFKNLRSFNLKHTSEVKTGGNAVFMDLYWTNNLCSIYTYFY